MRIPPDPQKGELIRDDFMALKRFAVASRIVGVEGGRVQETPNGTTIRFDRAGDTKRTARHAFKLLPKIENDETRLYVWAGRMTSYTFDDDGQPFAFDVNVEFSSGASDLLGDEFGINAVTGYQVLTASTTYGVWVVAGQFKGTYTPDSDIDNYTQVIAWNAASPSNAEILVTSAAGRTDPGDSYNVVADLGTGKTAFYLGKVTVDADGFATVKQWRTSDIFAQITALPNNLTIVSADANNDISAGSDGGAFYQTP